MKTEQLPKKILIADRDRSVVQTIQNQLKKYNINTLTAIDTESALYQFQQNLIDVCLLDVDLETIGGLSLIQKFRKHSHSQRSSIGAIILAGSSRTQGQSQLMRELDQIEILDRPVTAIKLLPLLMKAFHRKKQDEAWLEQRELCYQDFRRSKNLEAALSKLELSQAPLHTIEFAVQLCLECGDTARAKQLLAGLKEDPMYANIRAKVLLAAGQGSEALAILEKADHLAPKHIDRIEHLAKIYLSEKQPEKAAAKMKELIGLYPEFQNLKFQFFQDLDAAGFQSMSIKLCHETTTPHEVVRYYNNKGVAHAKTANADGALKDYYTALLFYPNHRENYRILFNIALTEAQKKTREGCLAAEEALEKCLRLKPDFDKAKKLKTQVGEWLRTEFAAA